MQIEFTEEDSDMEDGSKELQPQKLSGNQLLVTAELRQRRSSEAKNNEDITQIETLWRKRRKIAHKCFLNQVE